VINLERMGGKIGRQPAGGIEASRTAALATVTGLTIRHIGARTAQILG